MGLRADAYAAELERVLEIVAVQHKTAGEIASAVGISKPTAYARLKALRRIGCSFSKVKRRAGNRGPLAYAYRLKDAPSSGG
jgi:predicted transcriptional regulator